MNDGYACISFSSQSQDPVETICGVLKPLGLSLTIPGTSSVSMWNDDGTQTLTTKNGLQSSIEQEAAASCQFWYSKDDDIFCNLRTYGESVICELALDGLDARQVSELFQALKRFGGEAQPSRVNWIICDRGGELFGQNWAEILSESLLDEKLANRLSAVYVRNDEGELVFVGGNSEDRVLFQ